MQTWRPSKATLGSSASPTTLSRSSTSFTPSSRSSASPTPSSGSSASLVVSAFHLWQVNPVFLKLFDYHLWQVRLTGLFWTSLHDTIFMSIHIHNFTLISCPLLHDLVSLNWQVYGVYVLFIWTIPTHLFSRLVHLVIFYVKTVVW